MATIKIQQDSDSLPVDEMRPLLPEERKPIARWLLTLSRGIDRTTDWVNFILLFAVLGIILLRLQELRWDAYGLSILCLILLAICIGIDKYISNLKNKYIEMADSYHLDKAKVISGKAASRMYHYISSDNKRYLRDVNHYCIDFKSDKGVLLREQQVTYFNRRGSVNRMRTVEGTPLIIVSIPYYSFGKEQLFVRVIDLSLFM